MIWDVVIRHRTKFVTRAFQCDRKDDVLSALEPLIKKGVKLVSIMPARCQCCGRLAAESLEHEERVDDDDPDLPDLTEEQQQLLETLPEWQE